MKKIKSTLLIACIVLIGSHALAFSWHWGKKTILNVDGYYRLMYLGVSPIPVMQPDLSVTEMGWENDAIHKFNTDITLVRSIARPTAPFSQLIVKFNADLVDGPVNTPVADRRLTQYQTDTRDSNYGLSFSSLSLNDVYLMVAGLRGAFVIGRLEPDWGMGILASTGRIPFIGYSEFGDRSDRIGIKLFLGDLIGNYKPQNAFIGAGIDRIENDLLADVARGDSAYQAFFALGGGDKNLSISGLYIYRWQRDRFDDPTRLHIFDIYMQSNASWHGGSLKAEAEYVFVRGHTDVGKSPAQMDGYNVKTSAIAARLVITQNIFTFRIESGRAEGDANPYDSTYHAFTFNPEHRVGLVLFPEYLSTMSAVSAYNMVHSPYLSRPPRGYEVIPTNGGVSNAIYLYPGLKINAGKYLDFRTAALFAWADQRVVDPYVTELSGGRPRNFLGGSKGDYLGTEIDTGFYSNVDFDHGMSLRSFVQLGILFPGDALKGRMKAGTSIAQVVNIGTVFNW